MAKQPRKNLTLFGGSGATGNFGQFGSQAASAPLTTKDVETIQGLSAWINGWQDAVALGNAPYLQDMNAAMYVAFYELFYLFQEGVPEWNTSTVYWIGSIVKKTGTSEFYASLGNNNAGNALPSQVSDANWQYLGPLPILGGTMKGSINFDNHATHGLTGTATNDDAAAGLVGEWVRNYASGISAVNGSYANITTIDLTAGDWDISGVVVVQNNGATMTGRARVNVSQYSGNTTTDLVTGDNDIDITPPPSAGTLNNGTIPAWRVSLSGSATIYLKANIIFSAGTPMLLGRVSARRVQ